MSEVMVITGSNKAAFDGRSSNLGEIVSVNNGSFKSNNEFKCRCSETGCCQNKEEEAEVVDVTRTEPETDRNRNRKINREQIKENKSTQTVLSTVNGINGGLQSRGMDFFAFDTESAAL